MYITTEYDYELQAEVYKISGDKGYAHTTDTVLKELEDTRDTSLLDYFTVDLCVNVIRDIGESKVVFYDNGEPIPFYDNDTKYEMLDWSVSTGETTTTIKLGYDIEHNIYARYMGNKKGLPSKSPSISIFEEVPPLFTTTLTKENNVVQYDKETTITIPITFTSGQVSSSAHNKTIKILDNNELVGTSTITLPADTLSATDNIEIQGGLSAGLHHISLVFDGDEYNGSANLNFDISVGYKLTITEMPSTLVQGATNTTKCLLADYFDTPIPNVNVYGVDYYETVNPQGKIVETEEISPVPVQTDSNGIATFTNYNFTKRFAVAYIYNDKTYRSAKRTPSKVRIDSLTISCEDEVIGKDYTTTIEVYADYTVIWGKSMVILGVPCTLSDGTDTYTSTFNGNGYATFQYTGTGAGEVTLTADAGQYSASPTLTLPDVMQYWNAGGQSIHELHWVITPRFQVLSNAYHLESVSNGGVACIGDGSQLTDDWDLEFKVVSASPTISMLGFGTWYRTSGNTESTMFSNLGTVQLQSGNIVKVTHRDEDYTVYINGAEQDVHTSSELVGGVSIFVSGASGTFLNFDNLKWTVWSD